MDACSQAIIIAGFLEEVYCGSMTAYSISHMVDKGTNKTKLHLIIDAKSVYDAVAATEVQPPSEKLLLYHLQKLREWLDVGLLSRIT